jgi:hypothetical protein
MVFLSFQNRFWFPSDVQIPDKDTITNFFKLLLDNPEEYFKYDEAIVGTIFYEKRFWIIIRKII